MTRSKMSSLNLVIVFGVVSFWQLVTSDKVVMTNSGPVQGVTVIANELEVEAFLGVPYAEPPVGRLRFSKPVPKRSWMGVYDASRLPPTCIQNATGELYYMPNTDNMTEDCLYLNIWVPRSNSIRLRPIVLFIHGGAFNIGSSNMKLYDGTTLASHGDIIVVTINYRIGVMGFFSAFMDEADGNMGIYDQIMAMKWIKANAESFGGDPNHLVLMGESAGAMSSAGHMVSPLTKNLFKRVILQSGAAVQPIILDNNARLYKTSQKLAEMTGCADKTVTLKTNPRIIVNCLKRLPAQELSNAEGILMKSNPITFFPRSGDAYMPKTTVHSVRDGDFVDMEMLIGIDKDEGTFFLTAAVPQYFGVYGINNVKSISKRLAFQMTRVIYKYTEQTNQNEIADFYISNVENGTSDTFTKLISQSLGDYMITCNAVFHADFHSMRRNPVYFYTFSHRPSSTPLAEWMGTTHFDEVQYVFGNPLHENFTTEEIELSRRMMDRWINFAKTGNPNINGLLEWPQYSFENPEYLDIDIDESIRISPAGHRCEFWRDRFEAVIDGAVLEKLTASSGFVTTSNILLTVASMIFASLWLASQFI